MLLPDVDVLVYAHFPDSVPDHSEYARWLTRMATGTEPFAMSVLVLTGFVRIATNPRVFSPPSTLDLSFAFVASVVERPNARVVGPGPIISRLWNDCAGRPVRRASSWPTPRTLRSRSSTAAPWCPPTPILRDFRAFGGNTRCNPAARNADNRPDHTRASSRLGKWSGARCLASLR